MTDLHKIRYGNSNDELYTPISLSKKLIENIPIHESESCFDPFYGTGSFFNNFNSNDKNDYCEINLGRDFFKYQIRHDWVISNPPFSQLTRVFEHTLMISKVGFAYILPAYSLSCNRIKMASDNGFYLNKLVHFENPKEWMLGFQMVFAIFTKQKNDSFVNLKCENGIQSKLFEGE
jgi:hypothetical protein